MKAYKPLLAHLIDSVMDYASQNQRTIPRFNIETKCRPEGDRLYHPEPSVFVDSLMRVIQDKKIIASVTIQSFDIRTLQYLHRKDSTVSIALLIDEKDTRSIDQQFDELGFKPNIYSPHYSLVNVGLIESCHQLGIKVIPWTVNDADKMKQLKKIGVDGLITDYPDRF